MDKISSFKVDHTRLKEGLYLSRKDSFDNATVSTFDIRMVEPNNACPLDGGGMHTIEHIGATFLRNSAEKDKIIYFGPMGCKTGFYLVMFGDLTAFDIKDLVKSMFLFISNFEGEIFGATKEECGNYLLQSLTLAKSYAEDYLDALERFERFLYPEND